MRHKKCNKLFFVVVFDRCDVEYFWGTAFSQLFLKQKLCTIAFRRLGHLVLTLRRAAASFSAFKAESDMANEKKNDFFL
jgi:hypothetical protein